MIAQWAVALCAMAACGRLDFDTPSTTSLVQTGYIRRGTTVSTQSVPLQPTRAGSVIVVAVGLFSNASDTVVSITDSAGNAYRDANARSLETTCPHSSEVWYVPNAIAGATMVSVAASAPDNFAVWVMEIDGANALVAAGALDSQPSTNRIITPALSAGRGAFVASIAQTCAIFNGLDASSPFTLISTVDKNVAYAVVASPGSYGAEWDSTGGTWNGATVVFQ